MALYNHNKEGNSTFPTKHSKALSMWVNVVVFSKGRGNPNGWSPGAAFPDQQHRKHFERRTPTHSSHLNSIALNPRGGQLLSVVWKPIQGLNSPAPGIPVATNDCVSLAWQYQSGEKQTSESLGLPKTVAKFQNTQLSSTGKWRSLRVKLLKT